MNSVLAKSRANIMIDKVVDEPKIRYQTNPSLIVSLNIGLRWMKFIILSFLLFSFFNLLSSIFCLMKPSFTRSTCLLSASFSRLWKDCLCIFFHLAKSAVLGENPLASLTYAKEFCIGFCSTSGTKEFETSSRIMCMMILRVMTALIVQIHLKYAKYM